MYSLVARHHWRIDVDVRGYNPRRGPAWQGKSALRVLRPSASPLIVRSGFRGVTSHDRGSPRSHRQRDRLSCLVRRTLYQRRTDPRLARL